jgi:hypothetical protein
MVDPDPELFNFLFLLILFHLQPFKCFYPPLNFLFLGEVLHLLDHGNSCSMVRTREIILLQIRSLIFHIFLPFQNLFVSLNILRVLSEQKLVKFLLYPFFDQLLLPFLRAESI